MADRSKRETLGLIVDVVMMVLIIVNLTLIIVDWGFASPFVQAQMKAHTPAIYTWYDQTIHEHFIVYDLVFVSIFVVEILVRWGLAIYRDRYHRWFFYPFVHWYDVLGCIPVGSLRSLRLLRLIAMVPKLQRTGLVDLRETYLYETFEKYRDIALEEISDRVTVRIIEGVQNEIRSNQKVTTRIGEEVIAPQREALIEAVLERLLAHLPAPPGSAAAPPPPARPRRAAPDGSSRNPRPGRRRRAIPPAGRRRNPVPAGRDDRATAGHRATVPSRRRRGRRRPPAPAAG